MTGPATESPWLAEHLIWSADRSARPADDVRLSVGACGSCSRNTFPDAGTCTWCGADTVPAALPTVARATVATDVLHPTPGSVVEVPYVVTLARFDDGALDIVGRVIDAADHTAVSAGTPLRVVVESLPNGLLNYAFASA